MKKHHFWRFTSKLLDYIGILCTEFLYVKSISIWFKNVEIMPIGEVKDIQEQTNNAVC